MREIGGTKCKVRGSPADSIVHPLHGPHGVFGRASVIEDGVDADDAGHLTDITLSADAVIDLIERL